MKKGLFALLSLILVVALAACGNKNAEEKPAAGGENKGTEAKTVTLTVGATAVPHAEILKHIQLSA